MGRQFAEVKGHKVKMRAVEDVFVSFGLGDLSWGNMAAQFFVEKQRVFQEGGRGWVAIWMIWEKEV